MTHLVKTLTAQKMKKSLMENFIFCAVSKIGKKHIEDRKYVVR